VFPEADVALTIGPDNAELLQAAWWEPTRIRYGLGFEYFDVDPEDMKQGSGVWVHPLQILSRPQTVPFTGEKRPVELHEIGSLALSGADRDEATSAQRRLIAASGSVVEVRLLTATPFVWEAWQNVAWHERRKAGFDQLGQAVHEVSARPEDGG
jgi:hypothetical protein